MGPPRNTRVLGTDQPAASGGPLSVISRRKLFGLLAGGAVVGAELAHRSIFLPPRSGWPQWSLAQMIIPRNQLAYYAEGIAAGRFSYDDVTETMTLLQRDFKHHDGKWHSRTGRVYDCPEPWGEIPDRARIDDEMDGRPQFSSALSGNSPLCSHEQKLHEATAKNPVLFMPTPVDVRGGVVDSIGLDPSYGPHQIAYLNRLRDDAVALGAPIIAGTYLVDIEKYPEWRDRYYAEFDVRG
jgi:hypothetical protein